MREQLFNGRKLPIDLPFFDSSYDTNFPENQYFMVMFDEIPSKYIGKSLYHRTIIDHLLTKGFNEEWKIETEKIGYNSNNIIILINRRDQILVKINLDVVKKDEAVMIEFSYNLKLGTNIQQYIIDLGLETFVRQKKRSNINLVRSDMGQLDTEEYDIPIPVIDLELNYGMDFLKIHELIIKRLNKDKDKGIILLHGDPGTGKCVVGKTIVTLRNKTTGEIFTKNIEDLM